VYTAVVDDNVSRQRAVKDVVNLRRNGNRTWPQKLSGTSSFTERKTHSTCAWWRR